ncbi:NAD(P)-dependent oxidoreductase [Streptomyces mirabilis]
MIITVLGGTGKTGKLIVEQALAAGHTVHALVRRPGALQPQPNLQVFVGEATKAADVAEASAGTDAVVSAVGGPMRGATTVVTDTVRAVTEASRVTGVKRFLLMSSYSTGAPHAKTAAAKLMSDLLLKDANIDRIESKALAKASDLAWTIVDPPALTNADNLTARIVPISEKLTAVMRISRAAVANWMLTEAVENKFVNDEVVIVG